MRLSWSTPGGRRTTSSLERRRRGPSSSPLAHNPPLLLLLLALAVTGPMASASSSMGSEEARMYDRNLQHFSPEGRLYQVQYAERAAQRGSPVLALSNGRDALALCCERRRASRLEDFAALEKLGVVQAPGVGSGLGCAFLGFAGLAADGRRLLDKTRLFAENHRLRNGEDPGVKELAFFIADTQHRNTFVRAHRPYGVTCVLAGFDEDPPSDYTTDFPTPTTPLALRPRVFATGPAGTVQEYRAVCVGENSGPIAARLEAHRRELARMSVRDMARFGARLLLDARGVRREEEDGEGGKQGGPGYEVEVLVVRRRGGDGVLQARRVLLAGGEDVDQVLGEGQGGDDDQWFESGGEGKGGPPAMTDV